MKYLYLFLLVSTTVFSQNYHYALDEKSGTSNADITVPNIPTNLVANNITQTTATLSWTAATDNVGIADYRIYNNGILLLDSSKGPVTSYTLTGLSPNTTYNLIVRAVDAANNESDDSNIQVFTTDESVVITSTRFIIVGASIAYNVFFYEDRMKTAVESAYPGANVTFHNHASAGETIGSYAHGNIPNIDNTLSLYDNSDPTIQTFVIVELGGNDRTNRGPYATLDSSEITSMNNDLDYILDKIEAKGFIPILNDEGFRNYDDLAYNDEDYGIRPYNDNIIKPKILSRSSEFAFSDGQSFWQLYPLIYNNYETYLSSDNIHPSGAGYAAMKTAFVNTICKYIFTGEAPTKIEKKGNVSSVIFPNNMPGEDDFLNAHFYPLAGASVAGLQNAIDTYGSVRLEDGDYGEHAGMIYLDTNDKIYGITHGTKIPYTTIRQGSSGIIMDGVTSRNVYIQSGAPVTGCTFKNMFYSSILFTGASFENNTLINIKGGFIWDCSASGYFRNNTIIKQWIQGGNPQNKFQGNITTPSYGNLQIWVNHLTPAGHGNEYHNVQDITIIGLDSEQWNFSNQSSTAMTYMRNVGDVKITDFGGGNGNSTVKTPPFDIQADKLSLLNSNINNSGTDNSSIRANTDAFITNSKSKYTFAGTGYHINLSNGISNYNNSLLTGLVNTLSVINNLKESILDEEKKPIARPNLPTIPNPTGANWANDRIGKADQTAYIQGLVDTNKIAELPQGIYYIGSTILLNQNEGIRGAGTGKTAIVGLTDDFPLIIFEDANTNKRPHISNITLQGGHTGLKMQPNVTGGYMMVTSMVMHDVIFRDQTYGIHLSRFHGLDNNFFENVNFVNCRTGLFQDPDPNYSGGSTNTMMYMDKNVFYRSQVINCGVGYSMISKRPNNLNAWVDCVFDGNGVAADLYYNNYPIFANCDFKNHTGDYVVGRQSATSFYSCNFTNNSTKTTFKMVGLNMEGCTISDNTDLLTQVNHNSTSAYILNSTVKGNLGHYTNGVISNSLIGSSPSLNKLLININSGILSTILSDTPQPYPQYLVRP